MIKTCNHMDCWLPAIVNSSFCLNHQSEEAYCPCGAKYTDSPICPSCKRLKMTETEDVIATLQQVLDLSLIFN